MPLPSAVLRPCALALCLAFGAAFPLLAAAAEPAALVRGLPDFANLVEQVGPAVDNIRTVRARSGNAANVPAREGRGPDVPRGVGSGFLIHSDGHLLTNAHVIDGASEVHVRLADQREFLARVIGTDSRSDVALLKIDATGLAALPLGDVARLRVGEWVIAIGSPFDLDNSVSAGIVSAKGRDTGDLLPFIQTDVAINPGNSGGPLINMRGEVVGINSQIYSRSGGYMGISFAIPIDEAARIGEQLRTRGRVTRGRIGVQVGEVTAELAESLGLKQAGGALVTAVEVGGAAALAGIEPGDIITGFGERKVDKSADLPRIVSALPPGAGSSVKLLRQGQALSLPITVLEQPAERVAAAPAQADAAPSDELAALGLALVALTGEERKQLQLDRGLRVSQATGAAAKAGLREGDILLSVANAEVRDLAQLNTWLARQNPAKPLSVLLRRGDWAQYLVIPPRG